MGSRTRKGKRSGQTGPGKTSAQKGNFSPGEHRSSLLLIFLGIVVLAAVLVYLNSLQGGFIFDDVHLIAENRVIKSFRNIPQILGFTGGAPLQRPVRHLSYMIDYQFTGLNPIGYHISNILFHVLTCLLVFFLALRLLGRERLFPAFVAALIFAVHPVHTDAVSYISGRRDILSTLFFLLGFVLFVRYRTQGRLGFLLSAYLTYLLACFSKEMAITLPVIFLLYDWMTEEKEGQDWKSFFLAPFRILRKYWWQYLLFFITALLFAYYTVFILKVSNQKAYYGGSVFLNFLTVGKILAYYIYLLILPLKLSITYNFPITHHLGDPAAWLAAVLVISLAAGSVWAMKKSSWAGFLGLWFFLTLLPVCHIIPHHDLLAEHYLYLPSFAFCLLLGMGLEKLYVVRKTRTLAYVFLSLLVLAGSVRTVIRNQDWKDAVTMWKKTLERFPNNAMAHLNLGATYNMRGKYDLAIEELNRAYRITPSNPGIQLNLAIAYQAKGVPVEAEKYYQNGLEMDPTMYRARINLGTLNKDQMNLKAAEQQYRKILDSAPDYFEAHTNLGILYGYMGQLDEAIAELKKAVKIDPEDPQAAYNLGFMFQKKSMWNAAVEEYQPQTTWGRVITWESPFPRMDNVPAGSRLWKNL
ncbi:MAG: tetratricopeptide repeat protein [Proteobacteria bacterium]|nr:tetratricopeptide repeat protein [Pseudomonadota bacterium]